jgi:hypothetical protein
LYIIDFGKFRDGIRFVLVVLSMLMIDLNLLEVELSNGFWET